MPNVGAASGTGSVTQSPSSSKQKPTTQTSIKLQSTKNTSTRMESKRDGMTFSAGKWEATQSKLKKITPPETTKK